jgi:hypothetical protein
VSGLFPPRNLPGTSPSGLLIGVLTPSLAGLSAAPGDLVALETEIDRATPNVACKTVPERSTPVRGLVAVRTVCERVRLSLGLWIDAEVGVGSWAG